MSVRGLRIYVRKLVRWRTQGSLCHRDLIRAAASRKEHILQESWRVLTLVPQHLYRYRNLEVRASCFHAAAAKVPWRLIALSRRRLIGIHNNARRSFHVRPLSSNTQTLMSAYSSQPTFAHLSSSCFSEWPYLYTHTS